MYSVGSRVVVAVDIEIKGEEDCVQVGEHGTVIYDDDEEAFEFTIRMDRPIPALERCNNLLFVAHRDCDTQLKPEAVYAELRRADAHNERARMALMRAAYLAGEDDEDVPQAA
jgi:hypothetical protein